jgi:hypothetical protein
LGNNSLVIDEREMLENKKNHKPLMQKTEEKSTQ